MENALSQPFLEPVPWKEWGLTDYPDVVKRPMDLGTIQAQLRQGKVKSFSEFNDLFRLVVDNCKLYNLRDSEVYKQAVKLDKLYEKEVNKAVRKAGGVGKTKSITHEDRDKFCRWLFQLKAPDVGKVVEMVDELCPSALDKSAKDEIDLNVDNITADAYRRIEQYVRDCVARDAAALAGRGGAAAAAAAAAKKGE